MAAMCCFGSMTCLTSCKGGGSDDTSAATEKTEYSQSEAMGIAEEKYKQEMKTAIHLQTGVETYKIEAYVPPLKIKIEEETDDYYKINLSDGYCMANGQRYQNQYQKTKTYYVDRKTGKILTYAELKEKGIYDNQKEEKLAE